MEDRNIKFYSMNDMGSVWHLQNVEIFFQHWEENISDPSINAILELYNIKQYFDADIWLKQWTDTQIAEYKNKGKLIPEILGKFCATISDANLGELYKAVNWIYRDDFWKLICKYKVYRQITPESIRSLIDSEENIVWEILHQRSLVKPFGATIADHLLYNCHTAEQLISHFLAMHEHSNNQLYFPTEFTQEMRDRVLADYVEHEDADISSLQLLEQAQSTKEFPVSDKLKLKARKKKEILQKKLFDRSAGISYGAQVAFKSIPDGSIQESYHDHIVSFAYSREWIEENQDYPTLLNNFIYLFRYVDYCFRCTFVSLKANLGIFERYLGVKGKKDYMKGIAFDTNRMLSLLQMTGYNQELLRLNIRLEDIFEWFFGTYLKLEFGANGFTYNSPSASTTYAEKCKLLAIAIDGVLKQYRLYCEDGYIDRELLEMSSEHIVFSDIVSIVKNKYAYSNSTDLESEMTLLFSDQSIMHYTEKTGSNYRTLPQLIISGNVKREDFMYYQQVNLDWLNQRGAIYIADGGRLLINRSRIAVLKDLFFNEVICPTYYEKELQQQVNALVATGDMRYENTLFSKPEQDYLNYVLNKAEFSNGLDLRNKYSHDTYTLDEKMQCQDYLELQKIMVLVIIKINEEFCIRSHNNLRG